ncbi:MAG TPA: biotin--[acetyl-CoA-carboxylase] ligase [Acidimicrobiales bacterium]|nr:biotin--[acetyl-CoA-carboxylase] ligase [Acidimicrobiales bacterium]
MILPERVRAELAASTRFRDVRLVEVIDSTNRAVIDRARAGEPEGLVLAADLQTAGRGRMDRTWEAESGAALLVSVLLRPAGLPVSRWYAVTAAAALAGRAACRDVAGVAADIKWPNDLLVDDRKLAGILAEVAGTAIVVGMGLNVHGGPPGAATLDQAAARRTSRSALLVAWLKALDGLLGDWDAVTSRYRSECATVGRDVLVEQVDGRRLAGRAEAIDDEGRLIVSTSDGVQHRLSVGDVTHLRAGPAAPGGGQPGW